MVIGKYILIITLNVNGLNAPAKRHRLAEWIQKEGVIPNSRSQSRFLGENKGPQLKRYPLSRAVIE